jgi:type VI secretion system protein ImpA
VSAEPIIDVDELVQPIPGDSPGGVPLPFDVRNNLDAWRKEPDLDFQDEKAPAPPPAEWGKVIGTATNFLASTGKDLTAAVRLVEAVTKKHAAAGLRDGVTLLLRMAENGWEHVHPVCDPGDQEARLHRLNWLNDASNGGKFPQTVLRMPVVKTAHGEAYSAADWLDPARRTEIEASASDVTADGLRQALAELTDVRDTLRRLGTVLDEKMGAESPNLLEDTPGGLSLAVVKCEEFVRGLAQVKGVPLDDAPADGTPTDDGTPTGGGGTTTATVGGGRDQLYRQLAQIADALKRIEPHSPIPYLLERCVKLGAMPFPELMREVIREAGALDEIDRLLGLTREGGGG